MDEPKKLVLDMTATWTGLLPAFIALVENGSAAGRSEAIKELRRMATAADAWCDQVKRERGLVTLGRGAV